MEGMKKMLQENRALAYGLMALLVVLIIAVIYYYYMNNEDEANESYTAGIPPFKSNEMMTASYIPDSRSDREFLDGGVKKTLHQYGLPTTTEPYADRPGAPLPYSTENALYRQLHAAAAAAESGRPI